MMLLRRNFSGFETWHLKRSIVYLICLAVSTKIWKPKTLDTLCIPKYITPVALLMKTFFLEKHVAIKFWKFRFSVLWAPKRKLHSSPLYLNGDRNLTDRYQLIKTKLYDWFRGRFFCDFKVKIKIQYIKYIKVKWGDVKDGRHEREKEGGGDGVQFKYLDNIMVKAFSSFFNQWILLPSVYSNSCFNPIKSLCESFQTILKSSKEFKQTWVSNSIHENQTTEKGSEQRSTASRQHVHKFTVTSVLFLSKNKT